MSPLTPERARHQLLAEAGLLPLTRHGSPLRQALREAPDDALRDRLSRAWRASLDELHRAGFGTADAVAFALTDGERVTFSPDGVWPLGTLSERRPIAAWLDLNEASRWLTAQGRGEGLTDLASHFTPVPPWPGFPAPPHPGLSLVIGPVPEIVALCHASQIPCIGAAALSALHSTPVTSAQRLLLDSLAGRSPLVIALSLAADEAPSATFRRVETYPDVVVRASGLGRLLLETTEHALAFGLEPHHVLRLLPAPHRARPSLKDLEDARMETAPQLRTRLEATLLAEAIDERNQPFDEAITHLSTLVDLAREALDRELSQQALLRRGLALWPADARRAAADLIEARRLGTTRSASPSIAATADAFEALVDTLQHPRKRRLEETSHLHDVGPRSLALLFDTLALKSQSRRALALAFATPEGPIRDSAIALTIEHLGAAAIVDGTEEDLERLLRHLEQFSLPPAVTPLTSAWVALLAARRDAALTARDRLLSLLTIFESHTHAIARLAAERAALAARRSSLDGLVAPFCAFSHTSILRHHLESGADLPLNGPLWHLIITAEHLLAAPESSVRRILPKLLDLHASHPDHLGLDLAVGRLLARITPHDAKPLLLSSARGEPHIERLALETLSGLAPLLHADEQDAISTRLAQLRGRRLPGTRVLPLPPLTPEAASERVLAMIETALAQACSPDPWGHAVRALLGSPVDPLLPPSSAALGLQVLTRDGDWSLEAVDGRTTRLRSFDSPLPGRDAPEATARILTALAPVLEARVAPVRTPERPSPESLESDLCSGRLDFFKDLQPAFKQHRLTLDELRAVLHLGLLATHGLYRSLAARWRVDDYQRFMDFLRRNDALLDYRPYRRGTV